MALRDVTTQKTGMLDSAIAGAGLTPFGAALIRSATDVVNACEVADTDNIKGFACQPANGVVLNKDGFYSQYDAVRFARQGEVNALVMALGDTNIVDGDFLEVAAPGGAAPGNHGVLAEAGAGPAGETRTLHSVVQACEDVSLGDESYKTPASNVSVGDEIITMAAGDIATMELAEGGFIMLRDINGRCQVNRVKALTATVITLQLPSTVALVVADGDLVNKIKQCTVRIL
jgi:hypothetical protein